MLEISKSAAAGYAGCLLAELGHQSEGHSQSDVHNQGGILVERIAVAGDSESMGGGLFLHHRKIVRSLTAPKSATAAATAIEDFDVIVEDVGPKGLRSLGWSYRSLRLLHPKLVIVSVSPFGLKGAYSHWQGNDFLAQAVGGVMHTSGYDGEAPMALPGEAAYMIAGLHAASAALTGVFGASNTSDQEAVHIDISAQDTFMQHWTRHVAEYAYSGVTAKRSSRDPEGLHYRHTAMARDGWLYLLALREPWQDLAAFLGLGEFLQADAFSNDTDLDDSIYTAATATSEPPWSAMEEAFNTTVASKSKYQWFAEAAELGWTFAPLEDPFEIADSPQVAARGGMVSVSDPASPDLQVPPLPFRIDEET